MKDERTVVDLVPELKKEQQESQRWLVSKELLDLIAADIWPGIIGPAPEVLMVNGRRQSARR